MNAKRICSLALAGGMTLLAPHSWAADAQRSETPSPRLQGETELRLPSRSDGTAPTGTTEPAAERQQRIKPVNKASGLLGMEVRNMQDEKLGEIKDLVVDLPSGRVVYLVMGVGGFLGLGEKLLAAPSSAFQTGRTGTLVLNADRARVEAAPGFPATAWPSLEDPAAIEAHTQWLSGSAAGAPAAAQTGTTGSEKLSEAPIYTDADPAQNPATSTSDRLEKAPSVEE